MLNTILSERQKILDSIEEKKFELEELEKSRMVFSNNLTHQISSLELMAKSCYFYNTSKRNNLFVLEKFQKESFRDERGYFDLDYFDLLKGEELRILFPTDTFFFIKKENVDKDNFDNISGIQFKDDKTYLILVKYNLKKITRNEVEEIPMNKRKIEQYILVCLD